MGEDSKNDASGAATPLEPTYASPGEKFAHEWAWHHDTDTVALLGEMLEAYAAEVYKKLREELASKRAITKRARQKAPEMHVCRSTAGYRCKGCCFIRYQQCELCRLCSRCCELVRAA